jgi:2-methylcitrate dehydratase PrpD
MSVTHELVSHALKLKYEELPKPVIEAAKRSILDTLAVTVAGSSADGVEPLVELIKDWGGKSESTILVYGGKAPAFTVALANSTMARARDLDDVHEPAAMHLSASIVPAAFAISEYSRMAKNRAVSGKDLIVAIALGCDFLGRLRLAGPGAIAERGWSSETPAPLAVAMMGSKLLGFDEEKMLNALGIAYAKCAGNIQAHTEGALTVRLQQGFGSMSGVLSAVLAERGLTGPKDMLEGEYGYYPLYMNGHFTPEVLVGDLGQRFELTNVSIKPYPSCKYTHTAIYGALRLAEENKIRPEDVKKVTIRVKSHGYILCGEERKKAPQTVPDAQFSYYYTVGTAFVKGKVFIEDFTEDAIKNEEVLSMAQKVEVVVDPEKDKLESALSPVDIDVETKDRRHYKKSVESVKGHPHDPMSFGELTQKIKDCAAFSARPLSKESVSKVSQLVENLEEIDDVTMIVNYLA